MGDKGVRVNAVAAGPLATTAAKNIPGFSEMDNEWNERAPLGWDTKNAEPVAKVVNFLLSDLSEVVKKGRVSQKGKGVTKKEVC